MSLSMLRLISPSQPTIFFPVEIKLIQNITKLKYLLAVFYMWFNSEPLFRLYHLQNFGIDKKKIFHSKKLLNKWFYMKFHYIRNILPPQDTAGSFKMTQNRLLRQECQLIKQVHNSQVMQICSNLLRSQYISSWYAIKIKIYKKRKMLSVHLSMCIYRHNKLPTFSSWKIWWFSAQKPSEVKKIKPQNICSNFCFMKSNGHGEIRIKFQKGLNNKPFKN